jgi:hypothetical protein
MSAVAAALAELATRTAISRDDLLAQVLRARERELAERVIALERENVLLQRAAGVAWPSIATSPVTAE